MTKDYVYLYDSTLRDGAQTFGVDFSVINKLDIVQKLDSFGMDYVECGWPGANPVDDKIFANLPRTNNSKIVAFGMTRRKNSIANNDPVLRKIQDSNTDYLCIVGKSWKYHVQVALGIDLDENIAMIKDSVEYLVSCGKEVYFDAEHFFDGYKEDPDYAQECIVTAYNAGARWLVLCDTNGGTLPSEIHDIVKSVTKLIPGKNLAIHCHNDMETAVASSIMAVEAGARQIQGTINGIGERCGNANLITIAGILFKMGIQTGVSNNIGQLKALSNYLYHQINQHPIASQPFVGEAAFSHKGGLHVSAVMKEPKLYEHIVPELVGNSRKILISDQSGRSNILLLLDSMGINYKIVDNTLIDDLLVTIKHLESQGYAFDQAEASFRILILKKLRLVSDTDLFQVDKVRFIDQGDSKQRTSEVTLYINKNGKVLLDIAESNRGPVRATDKALRQILSRYYPEINETRLEDFQVKVIKICAGSDAVIRVVITTHDDSINQKYITVGVSRNILEASLLALIDSFIYKIIDNNYKR